MIKAGELRLSGFVFARLIARDWHFALYGIRIDEASGFVKCYSNSCPHSAHIFSEKHKKT